METKPNYGTAAEQRQVVKDEAAAQVRSDTADAAKAAAIIASPMAANDFHPVREYGSPFKGEGNVGARPSPPFKLDAVHITSGGVRFHDTIARFADEADAKAATALCNKNYGNARDLAFEVTKDL